MQPELHVLQVIPPELIPREDGLWLWRTLCRSISLPPDPPLSAKLSRSDLINALECYLDSFEIAGAAIPVKLTRADDAAHDAYFHIGRVEGDACAVLICAVLSCRRLLVAEILDPSLSTPDDPAMRIDAALAVLLRVLLGDKSQTVARIAAAEPGERSVINPLARWIGGHQLFAVLTQGLIFSLQSMAHAIRAGDALATRRHTDLSIVLLEGSAETFRFTGQFAPEEYESLIRPSMMPPAVPVCLSGLMSIDHRYLVQLMREMRPALKQLSERDPARHRTLATALSKVYDAHIHVCARFVGERPSIRTAKSTETPGPQLLENFRKLRLKPFEPA